MTTDDNRVDTPPETEWNIPAWRVHLEAALRARDFPALVSVFHEGRHGHDAHIKAADTLLGILGAERPDLARDVAERLVEIYPARPDFSLRLGELSAAAGRQEEAVTAYGNVLAHVPLDMATATKLARILDALGRPDEARETLARCEAFARLGINDLPAWVDPEPSATDALSTSRGLYLDLLEKAVSNSIYQDGAIAIDKIVPHDDEKREMGRDIPVQGHTMIGRRRLRHLRRAAETVLAENVPGDFIETGVWRGGACILLRGVLKAHDVADRRVFVADSFCGLPPPDPRYPQDSLSQFEFHTRSELAVSQEQVRRNFDAYGLLDDQVAFVEGFFKDTMPGLRDRQFSILRLDGDLYSSTMDVLEHLYDRVSPGGFIIIDDYGVVIDAQRAVIDFLVRRNISEPIFAIDGDGVYWRKPAA